MFVDWRRLNAIYCGTLWALAAVLALVIVVHKLPAAPPVHHAIRMSVP